MDAAYKYYNKFLSFESQREERNIILGKLFSENMGAISKEAFEEALYNCKIPVITEMLKDVCC